MQHKLIELQIQWKTGNIFTFVGVMRGICAVEFLNSWRPAALTVLRHASKSRRIDGELPHVCEWKPFGVSRTDSATVCQSSRCVSLFLSLETTVPSVCLTGITACMHKLIMHDDLHWDLRPSRKRPLLLLRGGFLYSWLDKQRLYFQSTWIDMHTRIPFIADCCEKRWRLNIGHIYIIILQNTDACVRRNYRTKRFNGKHTTIIRLFIAVGE